MSFARSALTRAILFRIGALCGFWFKYFDDLLVKRPAALDAASGTYFLGHRRESPVGDIEILSGYRGAGAPAAALHRE
jgi:hypothetical protein